MQVKRFIGKIYTNKYLHVLVLSVYIIWYDLFVIKLYDMASIPI